MGNKYIGLIVHGQLFAKTWPNPDKDPNAIVDAKKHAEKLFSRHGGNENIYVALITEVARPFKD